MKNIFFCNTFCAVLSSDISTNCVFIKCNHLGLALMPSLSLFTINKLSSHSGWFPCCLNTEKDRTFVNMFVFFIRNGYLDLKNIKHSVNKCYLRSSQVFQLHMYMLSPVYTHLVHANKRKDGSPRLQ